MRKLLYILIAILLCACEHTDVSPGGGSTANTKKICRGYGYEVVYTVRGDKVCNGYGYNVAYTIRGNQICDGYGYSVAYTIRDDKVCNGYGYNVAYTIRGNQVCQGYGYAVAYTIRQSLPTIIPNRHLQLPGLPSFKTWEVFCPT